MIKNFLITGLSGCGKTTLIKELAKEFENQAGRFFTQEIRESDQRVGFEIITLNGQRGILAHKDLESPFQVSKYKINLKDLEEIGVEAIKEALKNKKNCNY
jgi:nucleoside-triphosphatase